MAKTSQIISNESSQFQKNIGLGLLLTKDNGRLVRRIYDTGTIRWQKSALDRIDGNFMV